MDMGDKPSVEAKGFQSDVDDNNLCHLARPVNAVDIQLGTADVFADIQRTQQSATCEISVNGVSQQSTHFSPSKCKIQQSSDIIESMNGKRSCLSAGQKEYRNGSMTCSTVKGQTVYDEVTDLSQVAAAEPPSPSTSSMVTVVSVVHHSKDAKQRTSAEFLEPSSHSTFTVGGREKQTLGDILAEIESRSASLLQQSCYSSPAAIANLQFLAYQSRYCSDVNIKRRIITKLVDSGLINIVVQVLSAIKDLDCFQTSSDLSLADGASLSGSVEGETGAEGESLTDGMRILRAVITLMWNASEKSATLCEQCIRRGVVMTLVQLLDSHHLCVSELNDKNRLFVVKGCLGIISNVVRLCDDDVTHDVCRSAGAVKALQQFLRCSLLAVRTKALMILSYIATESENDVIHASDKNINFAVKMVQSAVDSDNHYSIKYGYWAVEIISGVNRLAGFELNKERLYSAGLLSLCLRLLEGSRSSDDEILVATQTFWILAFCSCVRSAVLASTQYMNALERLTTNHERDEIKRTAASVLWTLHNYRPSSSSPCLDSVDSDGAGGTCDDENRRLLIISHHTSGPVVLKIRSQLRRAGFHVHIDPDLRSGSCGIESLIENVGQSVVVLLFLSDRLKNSPACRTESEYALAVGKPVIPIRVHRAFSVDGWLGAALGSRLIVNCHDADSLELLMSDLLQRITSTTGLLPTTTVTDSDCDVMVSSSSSPAIVQRRQREHVITTPTPAVTLCDTVDVTSVASWSHSDVVTWLQEHQLGSITDRLAGMNGQLLVELRRMSSTAPESFYTSLRSDLCLDFVTMLRFARAVASLQPPSLSSESDARAD